jgi:septation ring formation regulator EzrA
MTVFSRNESVQQQRALSSAEAALSRIQKCAEAVQDERITAGEAVEQILDELTARPVLGRVREALGRGVEPMRPH